MEKEMLKETLRYIILCIIFLAFLFSYVKIYFSVKLENRIKGFAIDGDDKDTDSIADTFIKMNHKIVKSLSNFFSKSQVLRDYSKKLLNHLVYIDREYLTEMDMISIKFLIMVFFDTLYLIFIFFKGLKFNIFFFLLSTIFSFFVLDVILYILYSNTRKLMEEQLLQAVVIMNNTFKSGKNIYEAVNIVRKELPSPIKEEFDIISEDIAYGLDINVCFERFSKRVNLEAAKYITTSLSLLSKTGGNIVTVFNMIERTFYDRLKIKDELSSLTNASKFLYRFLLIVPIFLIFIIVLLNPHYFNGLIFNKIGYVLDALIIILYVVYIIVIKKLMKVEEV